jgi:tetratricopeptide (TPR) repeat protein
MDARDWDQARTAWLGALALAPDSGEAMLELSYVESLSGHHRAGRDWAVRAANAAPGSAEELVSLIRRLRTFNEVPLLRELAGRLLAQRPAPVPLLVECARQLGILNDFGLALRCAQAAAEAAPGDIAARLVRGQMLAHHGRLEEAASDFNEVLARHPGAAIGWWMLARLGKQTRASNHVVALRKQLSVPGLRPENAAALARSLHKELDDLGDHAEAWQALEAMCRARRATEPYDAAESQRLFDALTKWMPVPGAPPVPGPAGATPVFIVGMHRSGTTLLEQLLSASSQVLGLGELNDFTFAMRMATDHYCKGAIDLAMVERAQGVDFRALGQHYMDGLAWRLGEEPFFTDKQPANFLNTGFICQALPQAKILHMVRDPVQTCFSNLRELFSDVNSYSYDQRNLADYYLRYCRLMSHWHEIYPGRILDVEYARLTAAPETVMREVADFCGIDYVEGMSSTTASARAVATASSIQVREGVVRRERPKWAPYANQLQPLIAALRQGGVPVTDLPA